MNMVMKSELTKYLHSESLTHFVRLSLPSKNSKHPEIQPAAWHTQSQVSFGLWACPLVMLELWGHREAGGEE